MRGHAGVVTERSGRRPEAEPTLGRPAVAVRVLRPGVIPDRTGQQMLQPVRATVPDRLGDAPAVAVLQIHQQPRLSPDRRPGGSPAAETPCHQGPAKSFMLSEVV